MRISMARRITGAIELLTISFFTAEGYSKSKKWCQPPLTGKQKGLIVTVNVWEIYSGFYGKAIRRRRCVESLLWLSVTILATAFWITWKEEVASQRFGHVPFTSEVRYQSWERHSWVIGVPVAKLENKTSVSVKAILIADVSLFKCSLHSRVYIAQEKYKLDYSSIFVNTVYVDTTVITW